MKLFTKEIEEKLEKAGWEGESAICKIFNPYGPQTWVIMGQDNDDPDLLFGVADLGFGCVEAGSISRSELENLRINCAGYKMPLERDRSFLSEGKPLSYFLDRENLSGI